MHILFLSDNFPPEVNAPASRTFEHCRDWVRAGCRVTVITCAPNFPKGKVYPGYLNKVWQTEIMDGIHVIRVWSYISANEGFTKRVLDYLSYMVTAALGSLFVHRVDLVVGTSPQFFTVCAAYVVSRAKGIPFVFELRDLWPEAIKVVGAMRASAAIRALERLELFLYRKAALIISVTHSFKRNLVDRGVDAGKIAVVTNGVDMGRFQPSPKDPALCRQLGLEGKFVAGYVGTLGMCHHLVTLLEAADIIRKRPNGVAFRFVILGDGAEKQFLVKEARRRGLDNVTFLDSVPKEDVPRYWSLLDVSIIHLKKNELFTTVIPSKLFECMGMGLPLLHGVAGESAGIVCDEGLGLLFEPENAVELVGGLESLQSDPDACAQYRACCLAAAKKFDRADLARQMLKLMMGLMRPSGR